MHTFRCVLKGAGRIEESRKKLLRYLKLTNLYPKEHATIFGKLIYAFVNYMFFQTMYSIVQKWSVWNFNSKVSAIESLNSSLGTLGLVNDVFPMFNQIPIAIRMIEGKYYWNENCSKNKNHYRKLRLINEMEQKTVALVDRIEITLICFYIGYLFSPTFGIILHFINSQSLDQVILPFMFYVSNESAARSPPVFTSLKYLLPVFFVESFYIYIQLICTVIFHFLCILTVSNVSLEIDLFCMEIEDLSCENIVYRDELYNISHQERKLKLAVRDLAIHHQLIMKKVEKLNNIFLFRMIYGNAFLTIQLAILIFCIQKHSDFLQRIKYAIMMIPLLFMFIATSEYGQKVENQGNKMRLALQEFPWQDKLKWAQSTLKILMIRSNMTPQINVLNIFKQNRENMSKLMKLAYSYFNLLERVST